MSQAAKQPLKPGSAKGGTAFVRGANPVGPPLVSGRKQSKPLNRSEVESATKQSSAKKGSSAEDAKTKSNTDLFYNMDELAELLGIQRP
mmetsp:Transcript_46995/g.62215  ORF Transcript_46995/g.62215 Transcript_46995/m.62215 type:complete len:89 (-) Transcript_46995:1564-1830(-)